MKKLAEVHERKGRLYMHPWCRTKGGMWIGQPPYDAVSSDASETDIGRAARVILDASRGGIPEPREIIKVDPFTQFTGSPSYREFLRASRAVSLDLEDDVLTVTPSRPPRGTEKGLGFVGLPEESISTREADDKTLGRVILEGLARSIAYPDSGSLKGQKKT